VVKVVWASEATGTKQGTQRGLRSEREKESKNQEGRARE
jgi:hypothetical protein